MPLYDSVADRDTHAIQGAEWELHVREHRPVGVCQDCSADLFGLPREINYGTVYRDVRCRNGHERTIPGSYFKGSVVARPDTLPFPPERHLHTVPEE